MYITLHRACVLTIVIISSFMAWTLPALHASESRDSVTISSKLAIFRFTFLIKSQTTCIYILTILEL